MARYVGVSKQVLHLWKRNDIVQPSLGDRRKREMRTYTLQDVVAGIFAEYLVKDLGFRGDQLREVVHMMQRPDRAEHERAVMLTVQTRPKMMRHAFVPDVTLPCPEVGEELGLEQDFPDGKSMIDHLEAEGRILSKASLIELSEAIIKEVHARYLREKMEAATASAV